MWFRKIEEIRRFVRKRLKSSAHDYDHILRVEKIAKILQKNYSEADSDVIEVAVLLHDLFRVAEDTDKTGKIDHALKGAEFADGYLKKQKFKSDFISKVCHCIRVHRYRVGREKPETIEAKILFDSDKIDVLGAVGVARAFMVAGEYGERIYSDAEVEDYIKFNLKGGVLRGRIKDLKLHSPNLEFETKFKHIPDLLFTKEGRKIAKERIKFMENFFKQLKEEITG